MSTRNRTRTAAAALAAVALTAPLMALGTAPAQAATLPNGTAKMLQFMVAEEKMAHDVYRVLGDTYGLPIFGSIASSETRHQSRVDLLLDRYGVTNPTDGDALGAFDDPQLQALHDRLVASGTRSLIDGAQAGIAIERRDIADLTAALRQPLPTDVRRILTNLRTASEHHLAAFEQLEDALHATGA